MELSNRLKFVANHINKCESIVDIGTDHGYIPIYAVKNGICKRAIATDINKGPVEKAKLNISIEGESEKIKVRLGSGLEPVLAGEVDGVIIAGMGGNLIRDILEKDKKKIAKFKFIILQPAQNPEVLREYLYKNDYQIISEDLCFDDGIYYELFKVKENKDVKSIVEPIFYEISQSLINENHPLIKEYLIYKEEKYKKILSLIKEDTDSAKKRKNEIKEKLIYIEKFKNEVR